MGFEHIIWILKSKRNFVYKLTAGIWKSFRFQICGWTKALRLWMMQLLISFDYDQVQETSISVDKFLAKEWNLWFESKLSMI